MLGKELIERFQCPGCVSGSNSECGKYKLNTEYGDSCDNHVLGTSAGIGNSFALGLPKGFNKPGPRDDRKMSKNKMMIRLWGCATQQPEWDNLNIPVWAMEKDGFLFVRTYCPRVNDAYVDIIENGTLKLVPNAINVLEFINEID